MAADKNALERILTALTQELDRALDKEPKLRTIQFDRPEWVQTVAERITLRLIANLRWGYAVGTILTIEDLAAARSGDRSEITAATKTNQIVWFKDKTDLSFYFPDWQFVPDPAQGYPVRSVVGQVLDVFRSTFHPDQLAEVVTGWAATAQPDLDGREPRELIAEGGHDKQVLACAQRVATASQLDT